MHTCMFYPWLALERSKDICIEFSGLFDGLYYHCLGIEDICIELSNSDTAEVVVGYQSSRLDRENQPHSPCMGGITPPDDDDADCDIYRAVINDGSV